MKKAINQAIEKAIIWSLSNDGMVNIIGGILLLIACSFFFELKLSVLKELLKH